MRRIVYERRSVIAGSLTIDDETTIALSTALVAIALVPLAVIALIVPAPTTLGAATGAGGLLVVHRLWLARAQRASERVALSIDPSTSRAVTQAAS